MTGLDWIIVVFTVLMALWGYAQGLIVGALSLVGFAVGAFVGSRLAPLLLAQGDQSPYAPLFALVGALMLGGILASSLEVLGFRLRGGLGSRLGVLDGVGGGALVACLGLGLVWIGGQVALQTPGARELRDSIQRSAILRALNEHLPASGPILQAFARFDPFPHIEGPSADVGPPDARIARDPEVHAAGASVVKVLGTACGLGVQGSGWVAGNGLVVTNAHVVAGQDDTTVQLRGQGPHLDAHAVWFDSRNDLALLRAPGLSGTPGLRVRDDAPSGTSAAILGFPENGPYHVAAARLGGTSTVLTQDAYGRGPVRRSITSMRGRVRQGNSGGPVVDGRGRVVATIFAATISDGGRSGFGVPDGVVADALGSARGPVDTGPCAR
ncbi:MAG TPA: MarP family serine protease [Thermoleophilaceae bacterium]|nr:MarP family serine protease [Thermoleophilaceae bacterium]